MSTNFLRLIFRDRSESVGLGALVSDRSDTLPSGRRVYSWWGAGRTSIGPRSKPQDGKSRDKERTVSDRQFCYCPVGFSALAEPLWARQRRRGKQ
jgi:hypothetical protein